MRRFLGQLSLFLFFSAYQLSFATTTNTPINTIEEKSSVRRYNQFGPAYLPSKGPGEIGGGGNTIESLVKGKILALSVQIRDMNPQQKEVLTFDPVDLYLRLNSPDSFYVLCATNESSQFNYLERLQKIGKNAAVFPENTNVIYLDCNTKSKEWWSEIVFSNRPFDNRFFLHEAMRTLNFKDENDYHQSNSYLRALMLLPQYSNDMREIALKNLVNGSNNLCKLVFESINYVVPSETKEYSSVRLATDIKLVMNNKILSSYRCYESIENCKIIMGGGASSKNIPLGVINDIRAMSQLIYNVAQKNYCGE